MTKIETLEALREFASPDVTIYLLAIYSVLQVMPEGDCRTEVVAELTRVASRYVSVGDLQYVDGEIVIRRYNNAASISLSPKNVERICRVHESD